MAWMFVTIGICRAPLGARLRDVGDQTMKASILAVGLLIVGSTPALSQLDLVGKWSGTFEFIALGKRASFGPATVFRGELRASKDELTLTGQGHANLTVEEQIGQSFYGVWSVEGRKARYTCTMTTETEFLCAGKVSQANGFLTSAETIR